MRIIFSTFVTQNYEQVTQKFDQNLLLALSPPFPRVQLIRYDGNRAGDEVHLDLHFLGYRFRWKSLITDYQESNKQLHFVDEGLQLPFPLKYWRHQHEVRRQQDGSLIIDNITYKTGLKVLDFLLYPLLFLQFRYRKPVYRQYFRAKDNESK